MTKNHFNGKKSIFRVFLRYAVTNSKNFPDQDHTFENLLRSGITDFRDVPRYSSYLTRYTLNTSCFITFTTYTAKYYFTNLNFKLKNTPYNKLFIHNLLTPIQIRQKNIYYHAVKSGKLDGYKCVLNLENDTYELRLRCTDNTTDWKNKPLIRLTHKKLNGKIP